MNRRTLSVAVLAVVASVAFAASKPLENIPLKWSPTQTLGDMGPVDLSGPVLTTRIHIDTFTDKRQNTTVVAENREKPAKIRTVTTSTNIPEFVTQHMKDIMHGAGVQTVDGSDAEVTISGEVREFFVTETDQYRGTLGLFVTARNSQSKEIWSGIILGGAENFGRSYKADNYYETMSNMVLRATYNLLANPGFHQALQKS
jgi:hypothetical protein